MFTAVDLFMCIFLVGVGVVVFVIVLWSIISNKKWRWEQRKHELGISGKQLKRIIKGSR